MRTQILASCLGLFLVVPSPGRSSEDFEEIAPPAPAASDFQALVETSPFTRVLSLTETYALRGIATLQEMHVATLYNRKTEKTLVVSTAGDTQEGIGLVDVAPSPDLTGVTAKISFAGEEVELKYEESQLNPAPRQPRPGDGGSGDRGGDGERRGPSKEDIERYRSLSEDKQQKLREYVGHVMRSYPNLSREERGNMIRGAMIRLSDGRDLDIPQPQGNAQGNNPQGGDNSGNRGSRDGSRDGNRDGGDRR